MSLVKTPGVFSCVTLPHPRFLTNNERVTQRDIQGDYRLQDQTVRLRQIFGALFGSEIVSGDEIFRLGMFLAGQDGDGERPAYDEDPKSDYLIAKAQYRQVIRWLGWKEKGPSSPPTKIGDKNARRIVGVTNEVLLRRGEPPFPEDFLYQTGESEAKKAHSTRDELRQINEKLDRLVELLEKQEARVPRWEKALRLELSEDAAERSDPASQRRHVGAQ